MVCLCAILLFHEYHYCWQLQAWQELRTELQLSGHWTPPLLWEDGHPSNAVFLWSSTPNRTISSAILARPARAKPHDRRTPWSSVAVVHILCIRCSLTMPDRHLISIIYKLYFARMAARYKRIQYTKYTKSTSYTQTIKNASHWSQ